MVTNQDMYFSWIEPGFLAGCRAPRGGSEIRFLFDAGIKVLVRLQESKELWIVSEEIELYGLYDYHFPIKEGNGLTPKDTHELLGFIQQFVDDGKAVAVSCGGGIGRTGTILASYLVARGMGSEEAILALRSKRGPSIETKIQELAIQAYDRFLKA